MVAFLVIICDDGRRILNEKFPVIVQESRSNAGNSNLDASDHESTSVKSATNNRSACSVIFPNHSTSLDNWLSKPQCAKKNKNDLPNDLGDWLMVPGPKKQLGN